jgi:hypothetical protein
LVQVQTSPTVLLQTTSANSGNDGITTFGSSFRQILEHLGWEGEGGPQIFCLLTWKINALVVYFSVAEPGSGGFFRIPDLSPGSFAQKTDFFALGQMFSW